MPKSAGDARKQEEEEEQQHFQSVLLAFQEFRAYMMLEVSRRERHAALLSKEHIARLPPNSITDKIAQLKVAVQANQDFFVKICRAAAYSGFGPKSNDGPGAESKISQGIQSPERHMSKLKSTLHQCVREWSEEGAAERHQSFDPIFEQLAASLPVTADNIDKQKVLCPGAGLGRLVLEIAGRGYAAQGNEFSYFMLLTSNFLLNQIQNTGEIKLYPWVDQPSNVVSNAHMLREIAIPDVSPRSFFQDQTRQPDFSMCAGEFLEVYRDQVGCWDSVVTCFFIDTAPNVIEYIQAIHRLLRPGGVWINLGPLLYHWQSQGADADSDDRFHQSVELSYQEVRHVIESFGFTFTMEEMRKCTYTANRKSMMHVGYNCAFFTVVKSGDAPSGEQQHK